MQNAQKFETKESSKGSSIDLQVKDFNMIGHGEDSEDQNNKSGRNEKIIKIPIPSVEDYQAAPTND